jgi:HTH-type transcriptional regulator/antitoxin HipB
MHREPAGFDAGLTLVSARRHADMSQRDLARLTGVAQSTIAAIESGQRGVQVEVFAKLLAAARLRLEVVTPVGDVLVPFASDAVRDNAGRRFPAHLDVLPPDDIPAERISSPRYDRAEAKGWYHLRMRRDLARKEREAQDGHPTDGELEYRRLRRRYGRARWWPHREGEIRGRLGLEPPDEPPDEPRPAPTNQGATA